MSNHDKCLFVRLSSKMCTFHILKYMRLRLCLVAVKHFLENTYFPEMLISGKRKCFHVFGSISKNFPENIFWCLEKKKENTNPEKHKPQPRKKSSMTTNPVRRPCCRSRLTARSRSRLLREIAINGVISRRRDRVRRFARSRRRSRSRDDAISIFVRSRSTT